MTIIEALVQLRKDIQTWVRNNLAVKLDKNLGTDNANKILSTDAQGEIITIDQVTINVDSELSNTSENPVQNKAILAALEEKLNKNLGEANKILATNDQGEVTTIDQVTIDVDSELSSTSENPVQNNVINSALADKLGTAHNTDTTAHQDIRDSIITDYTKLTNAPSINEEEPGTATYIDEDGNIIAKIDSNGFATTKVTTNSLAFSNITAEDVGKHLAIKEDGTIETTTPGTLVQIVSWDYE